MAAGAGFGGVEMGRTDAQIQQDYKDMPWYQKFGTALGDVTGSISNSVTFGGSDALAKAIVRQQTGASDEVLNREMAEVKRAREVRSGIAGDVATGLGWLVPGKALALGTKAAFGAARAIPAKVLATGAYHYGKVPLALGVASYAANKMRGSGGTMPAGEVAAAPSASSAPAADWLPQFDTKAAPTSLRSAIDETGLKILEGRAKSGKGVSLNQLAALAGISSAPQRMSGKDMAAAQASSAYESMFSKALEEAGKIPDAAESEAAWIALQQKRSDFYKELSGVKDDPLELLAQQQAGK